MVIGCNIMSKGVPNSIPTPQMCTSTHLATLFQGQYPLNCLVCMLAGFMTGWVIVLNFTAANIFNIVCH